MKTIITAILSFSFLFVFSPALEAFNSEQPYLTERFQTDGSANLDIRTSGGSISVTAGSGNEVVVNLNATRRGTSLKPGDFDADDYIFSIEEKNGTIFAHVERRERRGFWSSSDNISFSFDIITPETTSVDARTSGGSLRAEGLIGTQDLRTSGGSITLRALNGNIEVRTSGGSIKINDVAGELNARTSGGSISAENASGNITLRTSGGSISATNVSGAIDARTSGGSVNFKSVSIPESLTLRTSGGSITAELPYSNYDVSLRGSRTSLSGESTFTGISERRRVEGKIGSGGIPVDIRTSAGRASLVLR